MSDEFCKQCRYAAICIPRGHERFFQEAQDKAAMHNGDDNNAYTHMMAIRRTAALYVSIPMECPHHPAKEYSRDVIAAMQGVPV